VEVVNARVAKAVETRKNNALDKLKQICVLHQKNKVG
jgi:hypothetical protein